MSRAGTKTSLTKPNPLSCTRSIPSKSRVVVGPGSGRGAGRVSQGAPAGRAANWTTCSKPLTGSQRTCRGVPNSAFANHGYFFSRTVRARALRPPGNRRTRAGFSAVAAIISCNTTGCQGKSPYAAVSASARRAAGRALSTGCTSANHGCPINCLAV